MFKIFAEAFTLSRVDFPIDERVKPSKCCEYMKNRGSRIGIAVASWFDKDSLISSGAKNERGF